MAFRTTTDYLKRAYTKGYISETDLYTTDTHVLQKIKPYLETDPTLKLFHERMTGQVGYTLNPEHYDAHLFSKARIVDPLCRDKGSILHVSDIDADWKKTMESESEPKEYFVKFER